MHPHKMTQFSFKMAKIVRTRVGTLLRTRYTRVRIKRSVYQPPTGVGIPDPIGVRYHPLRGGKGAGKPKADRADTKKKT